MHKHHPTAHAPALSNGLDIPYAIVSHHSYHHHHQSTRPAPLAESKMKWGLARSRPGCARRPRERADAQRARSPSIMHGRSQHGGRVARGVGRGERGRQADERSKRGTVENEATSNELKGLFLDKFEGYFSEGLFEET